MTADKTFWTLYVFLSLTPIRFYWRYWFEPMGYPIIGVCHLLIELHVTIFFFPSHPPLICLCEFWRYLQSNLCTVGSSKAGSGFIETFILSISCCVIISLLMAWRNIFSHSQIRKSCICAKTRFCWLLAFGEILSNHSLGDSVLYFGLPVGHKVVPYLIFYVHCDLKWLKNDVVHYHSILQYMQGPFKLLKFLEDQTNESNPSLKAETLVSMKDSTAKMSKNPPKTSQTYTDYNHL